jgi:hypothetical protein
MARTHWAPPDIGGDILAEAMRPDAAEPVAVHVRPEIHTLISGSAPAGRAAGTPRATGSWDGIRLVVDDGIPPFPGYEIHRCAPRRPQRTVGARLPLTRGRGSDPPERMAA